jgi:hypothetical protein
MTTKVDIGVFVRCVRHTGAAASVAAFCGSTRELQRRIHRSALVLVRVWYQMVPGHEQLMQA